MVEKIHWDDISIAPAPITYVDSRTQVNIDIEGGIPLIASPMDTVVDLDNASKFIDEGYIVCLPRTIQDIPREFWKKCFISVGISEIKHYITTDEEIPDNVLIDVANGHMYSVVQLAKQFIEKYPNKRLMVGNIAHPETYKEYANIGVWGVRCSVGTGSACTTSANSAIHYAPASLINEIYEISKGFNNPPKIIADGGFRDYATIIKALAVGADYVMLGGVLNKSLESSGKCFIRTEKINETVGTNELIISKNPNLTNGFEQISNKEAEEYFMEGGQVYKYFRGMSTKEVQRDWKKDKLTTSEGISKLNKVEYTLSGWTENFKDYLKSAMSYTGKTSLREFRGNVQITRISQNTFKAFNK